MSTFKGISFPFRFDSKGSTTISELTPQDHSRIYESIKQIVFTLKGERIMNSSFGANGDSMLFEPVGDLTELGILRHEIIKALEDNEDRIEVNDVLVYEVELDGETKIRVDIEAHIIKFMTDQTFSFTI